MNFILSKIDPILIDCFNLPVFPTAEHKLTLWMLVYLTTVSFLLVFLTNKLRAFLFSKIMPRFKSVDVGLQHAVASMFSWAIMCIGFLIILDTAGIDITIVTVIAGAVGLGASVSLQAIASNVMSGIVILFERPIKVGDWIEIGSINGRVSDIALRATTIVTNDNIAVIVPNAEFVSCKVINWTFTGDNIRFKMDLTLSKDEDLEAVKKILLEASHSHEGVLKEPPPEVLLKTFGADSVELALLIWTHKYVSEPERLQSELNFKIHDALSRLKMKMPIGEGSVMDAPNLIAHEN